MKLSDLIKVTKEEKDTGVKVPWDESGDIGFILRYCGKGELMKARNDSLKKKFNHKTHQVDETLDEPKFDFEVMKYTLAGWWGLKVKHLPEILDPKIDLSGLGDQGELVVDFNDENKEFIINGYNLTFSRFVSSVATDIEMYRKYKEDKELKNS